MRAIYLSFLFVFTAILSGKAQNCDCKTSLNEFAEKYKQTISYKQQTKDRKVEEAYKAKLNVLLAEVDSNTSHWECFIKITDLKDVIRDEHSRVRGTGISDTINIKDSKFFKNLPRYKGDLNLLQSELSKKSFQDVEGIYYSEGSTFGLVKDQDKYLGILLKTQMDHWEPGMQFFELIPALGDKFRISFIKSDFSLFASSRAERVVNGRFVFYGIYKDKTQPYHYNAPESDSLYYYKPLNKKVGYMRIATFSWANDNVAVANKFIDDIFPNLEVNHLIIDLRNNGGGTDQIGKPLRKAIKKYAKRNNIYVLVNGKSGSNAEQTTHFIGELKNGTVLGDRSMGVIAYGLNYGDLISIGDNCYSFYLSDLKFNEFFEFESRGVPVDVSLNNNEDWIEQTLKYIENQ